MWLASRLPVTPAKILYTLSMSQPNLTSHGYPASWPKPIPSRPQALVTRISDTDKLALYERKLTTRALAAKYGVTEPWVSTLFPGKVKSLTACMQSKKELAAVRKEHRLHLAALVINKTTSVLEASQTCRVSYRTMARAVQELRESLKESQNV